MAAIVPVISLWIRGRAFHSCSTMTLCIPWALLVSQRWLPVLFWAEPLRTLCCEGKTLPVDGTVCALCHCSALKLPQSLLCKYLVILGVP